MNKGKKLLSWDTEEKKETNNILGIVVFFILIIGALVYAFYYKQWSMGAVFAVLIIVFGWYLFGKQKSASISITTKGIIFNEQFYSFEKIKGYWFSEVNKTIYLLPKFRGAPTIALPVAKYQISSITKLFPETIMKLENEGKDVVDRISEFVKK